jgi:hypothetical protein
MYLDADTARPIRKRIVEAAPGGSGVPALICAAVATHVADASDYGLYAWTSNLEDGGQRWDVIIVRGSRLIVIEAQNPTSDWQHGHDRSKDAFVRTRTLPLSAVAALELTELSNVQYFEGVEWEATSWRIALNGGAVLDPPAPRHEGGVQAVSDLIERVGASMH